MVSLSANDNGSVCRMQAKEFLFELHIYALVGYDHLAIAQRRVSKTNILCEKYKTITEHNL